MLRNALCFSSATDVCGETIIFPSSKRCRGEASCQASDVMMQATSMGSYEGALIQRFRLSFLIKVFHNLTIHFHYFRRRCSQFSSESPQALLCFDQRPAWDADAGPDSLNTHTHDTKDSKNDTSMRMQMFLFFLKIFK